MPITMTIREDGRVVHIVGMSPLTSIEMRDLLQKTQTYLDSVTFTVHTVADAREVKVLIPESIRRDTFRNVNHPRQGVLAIIGANHVLRSIVNAIVTLLGFSKLRFFASEDEAFEWVRAAIEADKQREAKAS